MDWLHWQPEGAKAYETIGRGGEGKGKGRRVWALGCATLPSPSRQHPSSLHEGGATMGARMIAVVGQHGDMGWEGSGWPSRNWLTHMHQRPASGIQHPASSI
jgi:hypothetical protein